MLIKFMTYVSNYMDYLKACRMIDHLEKLGYRNFIINDNLTVEFKD